MLMPLTYVSPTNMQDASRNEDPTMAKSLETGNAATPTPRRALRWALMSATGLAFVGLMVAGTAALHMRANAEVPPGGQSPGERAHANFEAGGQLPDY